MENRLLTWNEVEPKISASEKMIPFCTFVEGKKKWGYMHRYSSKREKHWIAPQFDEAYAFSKERIALVKKGKVYGYIFIDSSSDRSPTYLFKPEFAEAFSFENGVALVKKGDQYGIIKSDGTYLLRPKYRKAIHCFNGLNAIELSKNTWVIVKPDGSYFYNTTFESIEEYKLAPMFLMDYEDEFTKVQLHVQANQKHGVLNKYGEWVIPLEYSDLFLSNAGVYAVEKGSGETGRLGLYSTSGKKITECNFIPYGQFSHDVMPVEYEGKFYFLKSDGSFLGNLAFDEHMSSFSHGNNIVGVKYKGKYGFLDFNGKWLLKPIYDFAPGDAFMYGAKVSYVGKIIDGEMKYAAVDTKGNIFTGFIFTDFNVVIFADYSDAVMGGKHYEVYPDGKMIEKKGY